MPAAPAPPTVTVTVPATVAYLRHVRVLASTIADDAGFTLDAIESLRVAVDELCALALADAADGAELTAVFAIEADTVVLRGHCGPVTDDPRIDPIAEQLLRAGSASHDLRRTGDTCEFTLRAS